MDVTPFVPGDRQVIQSYGAGGFRITNAVYHEPVLVFPTETRPWPVRSIEELTVAALAPVLAAEPPVEILIIGCGARMTMMPPEARAALRERGMGVEVMDTGGACRTYNVLIADDRRVAAALIPVD